MSVFFKVLGTQLEFHDDLKKYYKLSCEFQAAHDKLYQTIKNDFNFQKEPTDIFQSIETAAKQFIGDLINRLSNYGVFDRTASDYLNTNNGYLQLLNATTAYYEYAKNSTERNHAIAEASKESANASINRSISGLDFGIISSSIIDHAVYAAMNKSEIRKQSLMAFDRLCAVCNSINTARDRKITAEISEYYSNQYIPAISAALSALFGHLLSIYTNDLNACGQLDLTCLEHIDLQRSNEIIDNIGNIDNKQGVFLKALELCPYNLNVYLKGYSEYMLPQNLFVLDVCGNIIKYFSLEKALNNIIVSVSSLCDIAKQYIEKGDYYKAKSNYEEIVSIYPKDYRGWLGLLICETQMFSLISTQTKLTDNYFEHICNSNNIQKESLNKIEKAYKDYTRANTKLPRLVNNKKEYDSSFYQNHADIFFGKNMTTMLAGTIFSGFIALSAFLGGISNLSSENGDIAAIGFIISIIFAVVCACLLENCISLDKKIKVANAEKNAKAN